LAVSVLMVCLGNICRSPLAEAALRAHVDRQGLDVEIDSAGTGDWHVGHAPDPRAQEVARRLGGIDVSILAARQLAIEDFERFDHIVAMDQSNLSNVKSMAPAASTAKISLLLDHLPGHEGQPVPDPYYGELRDFENVWRLVDKATAALVRKL
jgi:protein-tyrosine phosphatase